MKMITTKVTKKGQITIPLEFRKELSLSTGTVVEIGKSNDRLLIEKPGSRGDIMELKGAWKDIPDKIFKDMRKAWGRWNEKGSAGY